MTPNKSGSAGFLAVPDGQASPTAAAAVQLLAYRTLTFTDTKAELIQFALSLTATQDSSTGAVTSTDSDNENTVLQPSTKYNIVMYEDSTVAKIVGNFTTLANFDQITKNDFTLSKQNFATRADGKYLIPIVFPWIIESSSAIAVDIADITSSLSTGDGIASSSASSSTIAVSWRSRANSFGNLSRGAVFIHTPKSNVGSIYRFAFTPSSGNSVSIIIK